MRYVVFGVVLCAVLVARDMRYVVFGLVLCAVLVARDTRRLLFGLVLPMLGELDFANEVRFAHALMSAVASLLFRRWRGGFGGPGRPCRVFIFIRPPALRAPIRSAAASAPVRHWRRPAGCGMAGAAMDWQVRSQSQFSA